MDEQDLRNADFSDLRIQDMTREQRAELRRRYLDFVRRVVRRPVKSKGGLARPKQIKKWVPGQRTG
jgi:hypothetical protein